MPNEANQVPHRTVRTIMRGVTGEIRFPPSTRGEGGQGVNYGLLPLPKEGRGSTKGDTYLAGHHRWQ